MSSASPLRSDGTARSTRRVHPRSVVPVLHAVGFWLAVLLPFVHLAILAGGQVGEYPLVVGGLLAVNVVGLVLGRDHNR